MFKSFEWSYHTDRHQYYNDFSTRNDLYAKYFEEQPTTRPEQVALLKEKLKAQFKKRFPTLDDIAPGWKNVKAPDPYAYAMMNYVYTRLFRFIRVEDNSIVGFKTRCTTSFYSKPEIVTEQPKPRSE